jgi:hypothetical protein
MLYPLHIIITTAPQLFVPVSILRRGVRVTVSILRREVRVTVMVWSAS